MIELRCWGTLAAERENKRIRPTTYSKDITNFPAGKIGRKSQHTERRKARTMRTFCPDSTRNFPTVWMDPSTTCRTRDAKRFVFLGGVALSILSHDGQRRSSQAKTKHMSTTPLGKILGRLSSAGFVCALHKQNCRYQTSTTSHVQASNDRVPGVCCGFIHNVRTDSYHMSRDVSSSFW